MFPARDFHLRMALRAQDQNIACFWAVVKPSSANYNLRDIGEALWKQGYSLSCRMIRAIKVLLPRVNFKLVSQLPSVI